MKRKFFAIMLAFVMCFAVAGLCIGCASKTNDKTAYELWLEQGHSGTMDDFYEWLGVKDGPVGEAGVGIASVALVDGKLVITYTNGSKSEGIEVPTVQGNPGEPGAAGVGVANIALEDGKLVVTYTDGSKSDPIEVPTVQGNPGADGVGIKDITISDEGVLTITYTDDRDPLSFNVKGEQGDAGDNGLGFDNIAVDNGDVVITVGETVVRIPANIPNFCVEHDYDEVEFAPHTCDENNVVTNGVYMQVCRKCGLSKIVREARHTFEETVHAPNCTDYGFTALTCTECGYVDGEEHDIVDALDHVWKVGYTVAEEGKTICEDGGMIVDVCDVCHIVSEPRLSDPIGHNVATWNIAVTPTKTTPGEIRGVCSQCPKTVPVELPKLSDEHYAVSNEILVADCTKREVAERYTVWVNAKGELSNVEVEGAQALSIDLVTKTDKHMLNGKQIGTSIAKEDLAQFLEDGGKELYNAPATCTGAGQGYFICDNCGEDIGVVLEMIDHDYTGAEISYEGLGTNEPTCAEVGHGYAKCNMCEQEALIEVEKLAHEYTYDVEVRGEENWLVISCANANECGFYEEYQITTEPVIEAADCTKEGKITFTYIDKEGKEQTHEKVLPITAHSRDGVYGKARYDLDELEAFGGKVLYNAQPTCALDGDGYYICTVCGEDIGVVVNATGDHQYDEDSYIAPTCTTNGQGACATCPEGQQELIVIPALGHDYKYEITTKPGFTTAGEIKITCEVCDFEETYDLLSVNDAKALSIPDFGAVEYYKEDKKLEPTCSAEGLYVYTGKVVVAAVIAGEYRATTIEYTFELAVETTGHKLGELIVKDGDMVAWNTTGVKEFNNKISNCLTPGEGHFTCDVCGGDIHVLTDGTGRHDFTGSTPTVVAPTCTEAGTSTGICKHCNQEAVTYTSAEGHKYVFTLTAPTMTEAGSVKVTCEVCDFEATYDLLSVEAAKALVIPGLEVAGGYYREEVITPNTCSTMGQNRYYGKLAVVTYIELVENNVPSTVAVTYTHEYSFLVDVDAEGHDLESVEQFYYWSATKTETLPVLDGEGNEILDEDGLAITKDVEVTYDYEGFLCEDCHKMIVTSSVAHINGYTVTMDEEGNPVFADEATSHVVPELVILRGEVEEPVLDEAGEPTLDAEGNVVTKTVVYELTICIDEDCELVDGLGYGLVLVATYEVEVEAPEVIA